MISNATVQSAIVLINRRMNAERAVIRFEPVCSKVADMRLHHLEGRHSVQDGSAPATCSLVILLGACYGFHPR